MSTRHQIFHDLSNSFMALEKHTESLLSEWRGRLLQEHDQLRAQAIILGMGQIRNLLKEYRQAAEAESQENVEAMRLCDWSDQLQDKILPTLATLFQIKIKFESKIESDCRGVINLKNCQSICSNLIANASLAGASQVFVELVEDAQRIDLIFRDNGCGMSEQQLQHLGLGYSSNPDSGHGHGFRIIRKLAADTGAIVRPPKSIRGLGTEITISLMKVG